MLNKFPTLILLIMAELVAQPTPNHLHRMEQRDSLYYLLTDNSLLKFYSHLTSGEFFLTKYVEGNFPFSTKLMLNDDHLFLSYNDSIFYYLNRNPWELDFENVFVPGFAVTSVQGFGPYFLIRSQNAFNIYKIQNGIVVLVEDSLFTTNLQSGIFFSYPFIVLDNYVYKFIEGFGFYTVGQLSVSTSTNTGLTNNTLIKYRYWIYYPPFPPPVIGSVLDKTILEEPSFPTITYENWGIGIGQLHCSFCTGTLIAKENLYYMTWTSAIVTKNQQLAYVPTTEDRAMITDYYIFLLGNDSLRYSKWNSGSTFYPFTWTDWTSVEENDQPVKSFKFFQSYPNPFNPATKIRYELPERSFITVKVFDVLGKEIATLVNEEKLSGSYEVEFNGNGLASGIYYYRITAENFSQTKKMILLK